MQCREMSNGLAFYRVNRNVCGSMRHPKPDDLFSISEAAREAGVNRSTIQRWIKAGRLKKHAEGKVSLKQVKRCRDAQRTGCPHGLPACERGWMGTEFEWEHAKPFLDSKCGLRRLKAMLPGLVEYHFRAGRTAQIKEVIDVLLRTLAFQMDWADRKRAANREMREEALEDSRRRELGLPSLGVERGQRLITSRLLVRAAEPVGS